MKLLALSSVAASLLVLMVACDGAPPPSGGTSDPVSTAGATGSSSLGGGAGDASSSASSGGACSDPTAGDLAGCGCGGGDTRACWTVDGSKRNANGCTDGTQACQKQGEISEWGPCVGEVTSCTQSVGTADASVAPDSGAPANCVCMPGAVRWCDTPEACAWGKQTCNPDGSWGTCSETNDRPTNCNNWLDPSYDEDCCLAQGQCCQDIDGASPEMSKGNCNAIACASDITP